MKAATGSLDTSEVCGSRSSPSRVVFDPFDRKCRPTNRSHAGSGVHCAARCGGRPWAPCQSHVVYGRRVSPSPSIEPSILKRARSTGRTRWSATVGSRADQGRGERAAQRRESLRPGLQRGTRFLTRGAALSRLPVIGPVGHSGRRRSPPLTQRSRRSTGRVDVSAVCQRRQKSDSERDGRRR